MPRAAKRKSKYSPHPGIKMEAAGKAKMLAETGRSFDDWVALARKTGPKEHKALRQWLRDEHGFKPMNAWWLAATAVAEDEPGYGEPEELVDALYSGTKAAWRPLHEKVVDAALACGADVIATSCKTMVPLYRKHVFAELRPVESGVEVHLALGEVAAPRGFEDVTDRNPGNRLSHRTVIASEKELDARFAAALRAAYDLGAGKIVRAAGESKVPADVAKALKASAKAKATWESCTPAMRRDWILWIESAKQAETRTRRVGQALDRLAAGKKKMY